MQNLFLNNMHSTSLLPPNPLLCQNGILVGTPAALSKSKHRWLQCKQFSHWYNRHSDLIKNFETTALTTCVLIGKIWPTFTQALPQLSLLLLRYTGILFIGVQVQHFKKSYCDLKLALHFNDLPGMLNSACKVCVKGTNALLTVTSFAMPLTALLIGPLWAKTLGTCLLPLARGSWFLDCYSEVSDYYLNKRLQRSLQAIGKQANAEERIHGIILHFMLLLKGNRDCAHITERPLALRLIRQSTGSTLDIFRNCALAKRYLANGTLSPDEERQYFVELRHSLHHKKQHMEAGRVISSLGYLSMHLAKLYPDGPLEWGLRWSISMLYLMKTVEKKLFHSAQEKRIAEPCLSS